MAETAITTDATGNGNARAERRARIEAVLMSRPGESNRAIAAGLGVSHHTVSAVREDLEATGQIAQFKKTVGTDGKARHRPPPKPPRHDPFEIGKVLSARMTAVELILAKVCDKLELDPPPPAPSSQWLLVKQAADQIGYSNSGVYGLIREKKSCFDSEQRRPPLGLR